MDIDNKIALFCGRNISLSYLKGQLHHLLEKPNCDPFRGIPGDWLSNIFLNAKVVEGINEYIADPIEEYFMKVSYSFNRKKVKLNDVFQIGDFLILSERAVDIVKYFDSSVHQIEEIDFVDGCGVKPGLKFYALRNMRFITVPPLAGGALNHVINHLHDPKPMSSLYPQIASIYRDESIREYLLDKGVWSDPHYRADFFMSGKLISQLISAGCSGLNAYTRMGKEAQGEVIYYF